MNISKFNPYKYILFIFLIIFSTVSYFLSLVKIIPISIYSIIIFLYFIIQLVFTLLNRRELYNYSINNELKYKTINSPTVTLLIVGYRENIEYWKNCLSSVITQNYINIKKVIISIDGNEEDDMYMKSIAEEVFSEEENLFELEILLNEHGGKRKAICNGLKKIFETDYVMFIDSDTVLTTSATKYLVECIDSSTENGCATGCLLIFDKHFLGKIINARYAYAFNIERSSMSYCGVMNCCSGPLSIYRHSIFNNEFIEKFENQTFCGIKCGPGDDRHLTNMVLMKGYKSKQTHLSIAYTEAPKSFIRFIKQQTRWIRSFYREQLWQIKAIPYQSILLALVTHYEIIYPILIFIWLNYISVHESIKNFIRLLIFTCGIIIIRTSLLIIFMRKFEYIYNIFYLPIFITVILPLKLYCLITMTKMNWTTSTRLNIINKIDFELLIITMLILLWNSLICYSIVTKTTKLYSLL
jgi:hyaluronan synthase